MMSKLDAIVALVIISTLYTTAIAVFDPKPISGGNFCAFANDKVPDSTKAVENCAGVDPTPTSPRPLCFALIRELPGTQIEVVGRGCWPMVGTECHELSQRGNGAGSCLDRTSGNDSLTLCCCTGSLCNQDLDPNRVPNLTPKIIEINSPFPRYESPAEAFGDLFFYATISIIITAAVLIVALLAMLKQRRQRLLERLKQLCHGDRGTNCAQSSLSSEVTLVEEVDRGNFGVVWRGLFQSKQVAVKIYQPGSPRLRMSEAEVYCLPGMRHPNILEFLGAARQSKGRSKAAEYWLLTTWHEMGNLEDYLRANTLSCRQLFRLAESIVRGVMHLHSDALDNGSKKLAVAHRDIKSKNILLKNAETACIADLGLAIVFEKGVPIGDHYSQAGTPRYMAPEVLDTAIIFDQQSFQMMDMYAVALVIWELISRSKTESPCDEYRLPYEEFVGRHASIKDMHITVVQHQRRPQIQDAWWKDKNLAVIANILKECWDSDSEARLNASTVCERLHSLSSKSSVIDMEDSCGDCAVFSLMKKAIGSPSDVV